MKLKTLLISFIALLITSACYAQIESAPSIEVAFSPDQGATNAIVRFIEEAQKSIRVAAYSFTSKDIAKALLEAHKRGVDVKVVLDKGNKTSKYSALTFLTNVGIPTRINSNYAIMHNKYIVVDGVSVQTGSFNYSRAAEVKNAENVVIFRNETNSSAKFLDNWIVLWKQATPLPITEN